jgi:ribulose-5-phosphate 4-epimerase/fuculose-1-phosphate aldolase
VKKEASLIRESREKVALACRILAASGICTGVTAAVGHASARIPGTDKILIKGRGYPLDGLEFMRPQDLIFPEFPKEK